MPDTPTTKPLSDQLLEIQMMYERGCLTKEEFAEAKRRLIYAVGGAGASGGSPEPTGFLARSTAGLFGLILTSLALFATYIAAYANPRAASIHADTMDTLFGFLVIIGVVAALVGLFVDRNRWPAISTCLLVAIMSLF